jgi:hypothetical protein
MSDETESRPPTEAMGSEVKVTFEGKRDVPEPAKPDKRADAGTGTSRGRTSAKR